MNFEVHAAPRLHIAHGVQGHKPRRFGPRFPEVGAEVGVVVACVVPKHVHAGVHVKQVVWCSHDVPHGEFVTHAIQQIHFISHGTWQGGSARAERLNGQHGIFVEGQALDRKDGRIVVGCGAVERVARDAVGVGGQGDDDRCVVHARHGKEAGGWFNARKACPEVGLTWARRVVHAPAREAFFGAPDGMTPGEFRMNGEGIHQISSR